MAKALARRARSRSLDGDARRRLLILGMLPLLMILLCVALSLVEPRFFRSANLVNVLRNASFLMLIASGQMMVLIIGGFDLSVGAVVALTSVTTALSMSGLAEIFPDALHLVILLGILSGLVVGTSVGVLNGFVVALMKVSPFMVTLGTLSIASGLALYVTQGVPVYGMPDLFTREFGRMRVLNLPVVIYLTIGVLVLLWWIMNNTRFGKYVYAIGSNAHAARVSGVRVTFYIVVTYAACSFVAALTGILLTARVGSGEAGLGASLMMESIAAAVIGGVSLRGGVGRVEMVAMGALFLALVTNAMNLLRVDSKLQTIVVGIVIIVAVGIETWQSGRARR